jgi:beta-1,4-N-acetylglucosaminyltransferase
MKMFITVGTTPFDKLIRFCDEYLDSSLSVTMQISKDAAYIPRRFDYFTFTNDIISYYRDADLIITHAGAGTVFKLLEMRKRIIVFPNLQRDDSHQRDLADVVSRRKWGLVCWNYQDLPAVIAGAADFPIEPYERREFSGGPYINAIVQQLYFRHGLA